MFIVSYPFFSEHVELGFLALGIMVFMGLFFFSFWKIIVLRKINLIPLMKVIAFLLIGLYLFLQVAWEGCYLEPLQTKLRLLLSFTAQVIQTRRQFLERDVHLGASSHPGLRHPRLFSYYERLSY